jgi:NAD(P)-dependent dehydrogenase (short-subunit alcohol dehydrogenase family)
MSEHSTSDEVLKRSDLRGKCILVTGASAGLGVETARALAARGAKLILGVRNIEKAQNRLDLVGVAPASYQLRELDLSSLESVRAFAQSLCQDLTRLDVLIANAGVMAFPQELTEDGFEMQFGTNHLGHFVLVNSLVPLLVEGAPSRVVMVSSAGHRIADVDLDDPDFVTVPYDPWIAYGRSKTANILFAVELDRRLRWQGVRATAVHPGSIETDLERHVTAASRELLKVRVGPRPQVRKSVEAGAATSVWAAVVADADEIGGKYCENCSVSSVTSDPASPVGYYSYALDPERAVALWELSERRVGTSY